MSISDERLNEMLAAIPRYSDGSIRRAWLGHLPSPELEALVTELQSLRAAAKVRAIREGDGEVVAYRGRYEHPGEEPDAWHLFHGKPVNGHPDWRSEPLYAASPIPATGGEKE